MSAPGDMHPVDKAFYDLTVAQRDAAWRENERLREALRRIERASKVRTSPPAAEIARAALEGRPL